MKEVHTSRVHSSFPLCLWQLSGPVWMRHNEARPQWTTFSLGSLARIFPPSHRIRIYKGFFHPLVPSVPKLECRRVYFTYIGITLSIHVFSCERSPKSRADNPMRSTVQRCVCRKIIYTWKGGNPLVFCRHNILLVDWMVANSNPLVVVVVEVLFRNFR